VGEAVKVRLLPKHIVGLDGEILTDGVTYEFTIIRILNDVAVEEEIHVALLVIFTDIF
jgi:hypothetical protein